MLLKFARANIPKACNEEDASFITLERLVTTIRPQRPKEFLTHTLLIIRYIYVDVICRRNESLQKLEYESNCNIHKNYLCTPTSSYFPTPYHSVTIYE